MGGNMNDPIAFIFVTLCGVTFLYLMWVVNYLRDRIAELEDRFEALKTYGLAHRHVVYSEMGKVVGETNIALADNEIRSDH
jgi:hypothetical protein